MRKRENEATAHGSGGRIALLACAACCTAHASAPVTADGGALVQDASVLCLANDHEIHGNVMAYQVRTSSEAPNQHLIVRHLVPAPPLTDIREDTVFDGPALDLDSGLPPLSQSSNGPEFGHDPAQGVEIAYTEETDSGEWYLSRWANGCLPLVPECWEYLPFPNGDAEENRWGPFASAGGTQPARIAYYRTAGPRDVDRRIAWRDLEDPDLARERVLDDPYATFLGPWARIDGEDRILMLYGPPGGDQQVALYDVAPPHPGSPLEIVTSGAGSRSEAAFAFDPASGRATLLAVNTVGNTNVMEVYQRIGGEWTHLYDFDAAQAGETDPGLAWVQSPEPFVARNRLYVAFVTSDTDDFSTTTRGNIRITRVESHGQPVYFRLLSDATLPRKRTEPEIHHPANDDPVVFYTQRAEVNGEDGCNAGNNTLRRARTILRR